MEYSSKCPPNKRTRQKNYVKWKKRAASTSLQTALWCVLSSLIVFRVWDLSAETSALQICLFKPFYLSLMRWIQSWFCLELWFGIWKARNQTQFEGMSPNVDRLIQIFFFLNHISYYHTLYLGPPHDVILNILGLEHAYGYPLPSWQKGVPLLPNNGYGNLIPPTLMAKWGTTLPSNGYGSHKTIKPLNITLLIESCTLGFRSIEGSVNYAHHFALRSIHRWIWTKIVSWRYKILIVCFVS